MANNFDSNFTRKVMMKVLASFESQRVLSKNVDTQLFSGAFDPNSGETVDIKRPTDYQVVRTSDGNITGTKRDIITGKASATVQDYITIPIDFNEADQALKMGTDMDRFWDDAARRMVVALETDFAAFAVKNTALLSGTPGEGVDSWQEIANASALMKSTGVPTNKKWNYFLNPFSQVSLSNEQRSLGNDIGFADANADATVADNFAGFSVKTATTLATYTSDSEADRVGALSADPIVTYVAAKDTMTQALVVENFGADLEIRAGEQVQITGVNRLNQSTRDLVLDASGSAIVWTATVTADVILSGTGTGTIVVTGPAIFEAAGAYNSASRAPIDTDIVTILGVASTVKQPNLFWHPEAFSITSINLQKLFSTDTIATTKDGLQFRVSKYSDGDANKQTIRFDFRPAYGAMNPFFAGQGFGTP